MIGRVSKSRVEALQPGDRDVFLWDDKLNGFGVKVTPAGRRVYVLQYSHRSRTRRMTIGRHGAGTTADEARQEAKRLLGRVSKGEDPAGERARLREIPTLHAFADRYLEQHARARKKPRSVASDESNLHNHVLPLLGHLRVDEISRGDVVSMMHAIAAGRTARTETTRPRGRRVVRGGPGAANRSLALLSKMFNLAERWDLRPPGANPCRHVDKNKERKLERFLSEVEFGALGAALARAEAAGEHPSTVAAIRLLILTGCRVGEILTLKWDHVDLEAGRLALPDSKTGAKTLTLGRHAVELLQSLPRTKGNPYVLPGAAPRPNRRKGGDQAAGGSKPTKAGEGHHFVGINKAWRRIRAAATLDLWRQNPAAADLIADLERDTAGAVTTDAVRQAAKEKGLDLVPGLEDVRLHDLRHSYASVGAGAGESLLLIGALLGHRQAVTTQRYAHLADDPLRAAADRISGRIAEALATGPADVVSLEAEKRKRQT